MDTNVDSDNNEAVPNNSSSNNTIIENSSNNDTTIDNSSNLLIIRILDGTINNIEHDDISRFTETDSDDYDSIPDNIDDTNNKECYDRIFTFYKQFNNHKYTIIYKDNIPKSLNVETITSPNQMLQVRF